MTQISFKISDDLAARMDELISVRKITRSAFVRDALIEKLQLESKTEKYSLLHSSSDLCGIGESNIRDLSSNPLHLEGFGQ